MNTNTHESSRTHSNDKRHENASATLLPWYDFVSVVDNPSISVVAPPNQHLINQSIGVHACPFVVRRCPSWMALIGPLWITPFFGCFRQATPLPPTTGQIIRVGNKLCFKKNVFKSHGFNWFHGLRRPGSQGCFRQARPLPPTTGQIIRVGNKLCFKKNVSKSHGFNWFHGLRRPGRQSCFRQARPLPPTTGQIIRVGNKLCFKKNVFKSHGFNWFHGLRRPGRQGCFRQATPPPPTTGGSFEGETTDHCERISTWRDSGSYAPFQHWCPVPQDKSGSEQVIIH